MSRRVHAVLATALLAALPVLAQASGPALRAEGFGSSDSDGNDVWRASLGWDVSRRDIEHWWGMRVEHARFSGTGWDHQEQRLFVRAAGGEGGWRWQGEAGSNGHDLLGSASVYSTDEKRKEFFLERDVLETRQGVGQGLVHTFAGAAIDWPLSGRWTATGLAGLQDFGGANLRRHLRANLVYALVPEQGLSLQLRLRQFNDSDPGEADYFAPGRYRQALGVVSVRRFFGGGYQLRATAGYGRQDFTGVGSQPSRLLELDFQTPKDRGHFLRVVAGYSDAPGNGASQGAGYRYRYARVEGVWAF
ncbi:hypothetical protein [Arenimonas sp.]|uniref:hypothetical protein n=1 Tax=Arenimonas sp. TaxID=1872635 RepID=UPI0035AF9FC1